MAPIRPSLVVCLSVVSALVAFAGGSQAADPAHSPLELRSATVKQKAKHLLVTIRMRRGVSLRTLSALPPDPGEPARYVCFSFIRGEGSTRICPARVGDSLDVGRTAIGPSRKVFARSELPGARVKKRGRVIKLSLSIRRTHLGYGRLHWRVISSWSSPGSPCPACADRLPERGNRMIVLVEPWTTGCQSRGAGLRYHGSRRRRRIALTFDDGPGPYTSAVQAILNRYGVKSTFFVLGIEIPGDERRLRSLVEDGHELGNHSVYHDLDPSRSELAADNRRIRAVTGFKPCVYRPPYGAITSSTTQAARSLGMATIIWDVDPWDWQTPGAGAIQARVLGAASNGSIVLMHDGGGDRSDTVAALPGIISSLERSGYRLVTVSKLLGFKPVLGP